MEADIDQKMSGRFEGRFLDALDIMAAKKDVTVTITDIVAPDTERDAKNKLIDKAILSFKGASKRFILTKINEKILKAIHGKAPSKWIGKEITLTVRYLKEAFNEENLPAIRIVPPPDMPLTFAMRKHYGKSTPWPTKRKNEDQ